MTFTIIQQNHPSRKNFPPVGANEAGQSILHSGVPVKRRKEGETAILKRIVQRLGAARGLGASSGALIKLPAILEQHVFAIVAELHRMQIKQQVNGCIDLFHVSRRLRKRNARTLPNNHIAKGRFPGKQELDEVGDMLSVCFFQVKFVRPNWGSSVLLTAEQPQHLFKYSHKHRRRHGMYSTMEPRGFSREGLNPGVKQLKFLVFQEIC